MAQRNRPIQQKLMRILMFTSATVLLVTIVIYLIYEVIAFRQSSTRQLSTLGRIIASNSTAALTFDDISSANEILTSLRAEPHIVASSLYDTNGKLFAQYPNDIPIQEFPTVIGNDGYRFENSFLIGIQPVIYENNRLGTLYLKSDLGAMYDRLQLYTIIALTMIIISFIIAYIFSKNLQKEIADPILSLAETAKQISKSNDYTLRARKFAGDELGELVDMFNQMLGQIQTQSREITEFNQKLEDKIDERTRELEIANKELDAFSYSVSHDLRAPLRSINGYARILLEDCEDKLEESDMKSIEVITKNAVKMGQLIDDLLAFSRTGKQSLSKVNVNVEAMAKDIVEDLKPKFNEKAEFEFNQIMDVKADSNMLRQVLVNLISNALKYSSKKEKPFVKIGSYKEAESIVYFIKDNGAGFDMKHYKKLFGVFQRLHGNNEFEGTGVGLALVHRIITKHNGKVWAEGTLDEGASFYFSLPNMNITENLN